MKRYRLTESRLHNTIYEAIEDAINDKKSTKREYILQCVEELTKMSDEIHRIIDESGRRDLQGKTTSDMFTNLRKAKQTLSILADFV